MFQILLKVSLPIDLKANREKEMNSRRTTTSMLAVVLCLSSMVGFASPTSVRSAASKVSSLGGSDNALLNELKEIVMFLSQKADDSDGRIQSLEEKISAQELVIKSLQSEINDASSFHRYLQTSDSECLPRFRDTPFGPRCDFSYVTRFQNRTFFNDNVVFNENVEFDSDANCMPIFNSTSQMCTLKNNFTFDEGDILFNHTVEFGSDTSCMPTFNSTSQMCTMNNNFTFDEGDIIFNHSVKFEDDAEFDELVRFRDLVKFEDDVEFKNGGEVTFRKKVLFEEDVLIENDDHHIEFKLKGKVTARFYQDETTKFDSHTIFYKDVKMEEDLRIRKKLEVKEKTYLDDLELYGYLWVDKWARIDGEFTANHRGIVKGGLDIKTGGLHVSHGAIIDGKLTGNHGATFEGGLEVVTGRLHVSHGATIDGELTGNHGATFEGGLNVITGELQVSHGAQIHGGLNASNGLFADFAEIGSTSISRKLSDSNTAVLKITGPVDVHGNIDTTSITAQNTNFGIQSNTTSPPQGVDTRMIEELINGLNEYDGVVYLKRVRAMSIEVNDYFDDSSGRALEAGTRDLADVGKMSFMDVNVATMVDIDNTKREINALLESMTPVEASCTCGQTDIEPIVNKSYVSDMGFVQVSDIQDELDAIQTLVSSTTSPVEASCTCDPIDIQDIVNDYVSDMGFVVQVSDMEDKLDAIQSLVSSTTSPVEASCTCGDEIEAFKDEVKSMFAENNTEGGS